MYLVYRHIRPDTNQVFYIGKGKEGNKRPKSPSGRNSHWHNIVNKNSGEYEVEIMVTGLTHEEACDKEVEFIELYGRKCDGGTLCNISLGGDGAPGVIPSQETRYKLASYGMEGKKHSCETKKKISQSQKGIPKPKGGKKAKGCIGHNLVTNELKKFRSYMEAERYTSVNHNHIRKLIKGVGKQCKNWTFKPLLN